MRLLTSSLRVSPAADVRWSFDTFGNSIALLTFAQPAQALLIESELTVRRYGYDDPMDRLIRHTGHYPFEYEPDEVIDLAPMRDVQQTKDQPAVAAWLTEAIPSTPSEAMALLHALVRAIHQGFTYGRREIRGVQRPAETIRLGTGTCRDFALLFMEAARHYGFAARFVTGYLYDPAADGGSLGASHADGAGLSGGGATHAWADVFLPGAGWVEFDPTNRIIAGRNLIRIATTRTPSQALPVSGSYRATGARCLGMEVEVQVTRLG